MIWKKFWGTFEVSEEGVVRNFMTDNIITPQKHHHGYLYVYLYYRGIQRKFRVNRIVAENFIPNPKGYKEVIFINRNKSDNRVENLMWGNRYLSINLGKPVMMIKNNKTLRIFDSLKEAVKFGYSQKLILQALRDGTEYRGCLWKFDIMKNSHNKP